MRLYFLAYLIVKHKYLKIVKKPHNTSVTFNPDNKVYWFAEFVSFFKSSIVTVVRSSFTVTLPRIWD